MKSLPAIGAALLLAATCPHVVLAVSTLDQENPLPGQRDPRVGTLPPVIYDAAQVFKVGITGKLTSVQAYIDKAGSPTADVTLDVRTTTAGIPDTGGVLAATSVPSSAISFAGGFVQFDLTSANLFVSAGDELAFVLSSPEDFTSNVSEYVAWAADTFYGQAAYPHGDAYHGDVDAGTASLLATRDLIFRTYVDPVPEPSTFVLLSLLGLCAVLCWRQGGGAFHGQQAALSVAEPSGRFSSRFLLTRTHRRWQRRSVINPLARSFSATPQESTHSETGDYSQLLMRMTAQLGTAENSSPRSA